MSEELTLTNDNGYREEFSLSEAVRVVVNGADDFEDRLNAVSRLIVAMLEKQPPDEILRVLNTADWRHSWRKL